MEQKRNRDKLRPDGPLGSYKDLNFVRVWANDCFTTGGLFAILNCVDNENVDNENENGLFLMRAVSPSTA